MNATSLADLWVQAAINVDNEEAIVTDSESGASDHEEGPSDIPAPSTSRRNTGTAATHHRPSMGSNTSRPGGGLRRLGIMEPAGVRRPSTGSFVPAIFSHTGVRTPPNIVPVPTPGHQTPDHHHHVDMTQLSMIAESRPGSELIEEKPSAWKMLPLMIIFQYGLLALHGTTHDQIFYLYVVS
jgi:hypothetical protein